MKIEAVGNTKEDVEALLNYKREAVLAENKNIVFGNVEKYGNCEIGWKYVQEYEVVI